MFIGICIKMFCNFSPQEHYTHLIDVGNNKTTTLEIKLTLALKQPTKILIKVKVSSALSDQIKAIVELAATKLQITVMKQKKNLH